MVLRERPARFALVAAAASAVAACGGGGGTETAGASSGDGVNSPPTIRGQAAPSVVENELYEFTPTASDPDGDALIFHISGKPVWLEFDAKTGRAWGHPKDRDVGRHRGIVISASDGYDETPLDPIDVEVLPADAADNTPPEIAGTPAGSVIVGQSYTFVPTVFDADADALTFSIENMPSWASFDAAIGGLTGTPATGDVGVYGDIVISVSDGIATASLDAFVIVVNPPPSTNAVPTIWGQPAASVLIGDAYSFRPSASDADGDTLVFNVFNLPAWAGFDTATGLVSGTPVAGDVGSYTGIGIVVSDGEASAALPVFNIEVVDPNVPPVISGTPPSLATVGAVYDFTPTVQNDDGDMLVFTVQNGPSWTTFDSATGRLSGTPGPSHVQTYTSIRITVSDGAASATLGPFSITVEAANTGPAISGTPGSSVVVGQPYAFTPTASDANGDALSFSMINRPSWLTFSTANGHLTGTPGAGDVGIYGNMSIIVSDGATTATLGPFAIEVLPISLGSAIVTWTPPTENTDGSPLTDLAAYKVYWGTVPGSYPNSTTIDNVAVTAHVVENLTPGTYYFVTTALNGDGIESEHSNEASWTIE